MLLEAGGKETLLWRGRKYKTDNYSNVENRGYTKNLMIWGKEIRFPSKVLSVLSIIF